MVKLKELKIDLQGLEDLKEALNAGIELRTEARKKLNNTKADKICYEVDTAKIYRMTKLEYKINLKIQKLWE